MKMVQTRLAERSYTRMRIVASLVVLAGLSSAGPAASASFECAVAGEKIHWVADYCMALLETDDEIPAGPCIGAELGKAFADDCAAKRHYKRALCERSIGAGPARGDMERCLADPAFAGDTVRRAGVGGIDPRRR